jgi:hypothetical protein
MEHIDQLAEGAVKEAIQTLAANGKRAYSGNVPVEAEQALLKKARGRISRTEAQSKVRQAIERLRARKEIKAPQAKQHEWVLISRRQPPATIGG